MLHLSSYGEALAIRIPRSDLSRDQSGELRSWIFDDGKTRQAFEKCLFEACEQFDWVLHAYSVMSNHYHLALEATDPI
ncbi:transposase [Pelagicoccus sp. NFK12]|uniref:Transposase n=1 Tax=Pelagicoccus enzymogenes TaxID=2773457 RepID=A0A927F6T2_9BACT|nr:transposase [Pelagicoccus enzymogenes]